MKKGDLVVYSDQETMPQWANTYGISTEIGWEGNAGLVLVQWVGELQPTIHYKYELAIITNKGYKHGKYILGRSESSKGGSG